MLKRQFNQLDILASWRSQLAAMVQAKPWLGGVLLRRGRRLLRRFAHFYRRLQALPRRQRRLLQRKLGRALAGTALLLALSGGPAQANDITVAAGIVDINGNDGQCSLIEALENANDAGSGQPHSDCAPGDSTGADTLHLAAGSAFTLRTVNDSSFNTGLPPIRSEVTIEGNGAVIRRDESAPEFGLLAVKKPGRLTLNETTISGGSKVGRGGAVFQNAGSGPLTIKNSTISGNRATIGGGGVYIIEGNLTVDNSTISGNQAAAGGGIFLLKGRITIDDSTISGNRATFGGGIVNYAVKRTTISNSTISGNQVMSRGGGMINNFSQVIINNSTIFDNRASSGGGLYNTASSLEINNSTLSHNRATSGGGLFNIGDVRFNTAGSLEINNSTLSHNRAASGGGVYADSYSTTDVNNTTISGNVATNNGGGVFNRSGREGRTALNRSLIAGNIAPRGAEISNTTTGVINANNYNLVGHAGLTSTQAFDNFMPGSNDISAAGDGPTPTALPAILSPTLADNGGETQTHALVFGSPALNAASTSDCAAAPINGVDQRGRPRNIPGGIGNNNQTACDVGAFELQPGQLTTVKKLLPVKDTKTVLDFPFEGPLGPFILTTNTPANNQTFELPPGVYTFRENAPSLFGLLSLLCIDDQGNDVTEAVVSNFSKESMIADITLVGEGALRCTFFNQRVTFEADDVNDVDKNYHRFYLPILVK